MNIIVSKILQCVSGMPSLRQHIIFFCGSHLTNVVKAFYPLPNEVARGHSNATVRHNPCEHSRINILQWILTKLSTYLVLTRVWIPIDFQDQRSRSAGQIFTA